MSAAKAPKKRCRPRRCSAGRRRLLSGGASRPGRPRPDVLRRRQADDRLRLRSQQRGSDRAPAGRQDRRGRRRRTDSYGDDFALARYNPNGSLDTSFSGDGRQTTDFGRRRLDRATGVALQARRQDRRGRRRRRRLTGDFALARYNPNGSLDTSFSGDGRQTTDFGGFDGANGVALQGDGKIVAVGDSGAGGTGDFALARYNPNGSLDPSFSGDGKQTTDFGGPTRRTGWRSRRTARSSRSARRRHRRLRARPLQPERLARHELLRRRQADDRLRGLRRGERGGAPGRRQDRRGRRRRAASAPRLRARPLQPERLARPELLRRRQADDRLRGLRRGERGGAPGRRQDRRGRRAAAPADDFALARYNPNGSLDPSFSGDGRQTTDFGGSDGASGVALQGDGKIVAVGGGGAGDPATSRSPATTPTARSTRASPATASRRPTSGAPTGRPGWRSRATARSSRSAAPAATARRLRARPLQPERLARHELLRRRQADDRLRGRRRGDRGGAPGRRQDRRGRRRRQRPAPATSRSPATTRTARSTRASPATASRRPTSGASTGATGVALQGDGKIVAVGDGGRAPPATSRSPATTPTARSTRASPATASRRPTSGASTAATGVALQGDGKIVAVGVSSAAAAATSRSPATTRTARSTRASPATAGRRPTSGASTGRPGWRSRATARSSRSARRPDAEHRRLRARPLQPERLARHELLRRRQADDRLRGLRRGDRGGAPGRRQDRRGRLQLRRRRRRRLRARPLQPQRLARHELLRRRQADDRLRGLRRRRTGWRSRATARSSRSGSASAPTEPAISRLPAIWGAEPRTG